MSMEPTVLIDELPSSRRDLNNSDGLMQEEISHLLTSHAD